jgi:hypothetical protein
MRSCLCILLTVLLLACGRSPLLAPASPAALSDAGARPILDASHDASTDRWVAESAHPSSCRATGRFVARGGYSPGSIPYAVAAGDFDGDGFPDLAVATGDNIAILRNRKDATFVRSAVFDEGDWPVAVEPADLDRDGFLDLVAVSNVNGSSKVSLLMGRGNGSFGTPTSFAADSVPTNVQIGDLDGDGSPDLVVANSTTVSVFRNRGDGTFLPQVLYPTSGVPHLALADFDRDGYLDLAVSNSRDSTVGVFYNDGTGTLQGPVVYRADGETATVAAADFDGDGWPDLAVANYDSSTIAIFLNRGDGSLRRVGSYAVGAYAGSLLAADFNADGSPDLVVVNQNDDSLSVLLGRKDGTFEAQALYATGRLPETIAVGDFNQDGALDLAVTYWQDVSVGLFMGECL